MPNLLLLLLYSHPIIVRCRYLHCHKSSCSPIVVCSRYIAIMHPIKAHLYCSRRRILSAICCFWHASLVFGLPTVVYNTVTRPSDHFPVKLCIMVVPHQHRLYHDIIFKSTEFLLFFLCPVLTQVVLYTIIGRRLFAARGTLFHDYSDVAQLTRDATSPRTRPEPQHMRARKGVVKMLIASVLVYFLSFAPSQIPLFYDIACRVPFKVNWSYLVLVMTLGYVNSAANPILYSVFSQNYRLRFDRLLCHGERRRRSSHMTATSSPKTRSLNSRPPARLVTDMRSGNTRTVVSEGDYQMS